MSNQQDFANWLQEIDLSTDECQLILDSWEVKKIEFANNTKKVARLNLKPLVILPLPTVDKLVKKLENSPSRPQIIWEHKTCWKEYLTNIKSYLDHFFRQQLSENDIRKIDFLFDYVDNDRLKITFPSQYLYDVFGKNNSFQEELLFFLKGYGIYVASLNIFYDSAVKTETKQSPFKTKSKEEIQTLINQTREGVIEGKILNVNNKMFSNKQTFEFLLEGREETKELILAKEATIFDPDRDTDLLKKGQWLKVHFFKAKNNPNHKITHTANGNYQFQKRKLKDVATKLEKIAPFFKRLDQAPEKRVELHTHTKMSGLDGIGDIEDYLAYANHWQHQAIAITDHQNVHIFPDCDKIAQKYPDLKVIFGCEFEFLAKAPVVLTDNLEGSISDAKLLFFDLETTGLSAYFDEIIEFAGVVVQNGITIKKESFLIQAKKTVPQQIYEFTHIDPKEHQTKAIPFAQAMQRINNLLTDTVLVAHNANFDVTFLNIAFAKLGLPPIQNPVLDTLSLGYFLEPKLSSYRLQRLARRYKVPYSKSESHRAIYDTKVLQKLFFNMTSKLSTFQQLFAMNQSEQLFHKGFYDHIILLAKNKTGLKALYHLVSHTHTETLYKKPLLLKSELEKYRQHLLVGSSCYNGEVFKAACYSDDQTLINKIKFYDYLEVQPLEVYQHLIIKEILTKTDLEKAVWRIIKFAKQLNKLVVATGDVHYLHPEHRPYRDIFVFNKQLRGEWHDLYDFRERLKATPPQYFRTTEEMLGAFAFLKDQALIKEIVITNPNLIANQIEKVRCFEQDFVMPQFKNASQILKNTVAQKMLAKYGPHPDVKVQKRLDQELKNIIDAKYATIYLISYYLTDYTTKQNHFFGSRGSVGSSFVAHCLDITEVNPLSPHYLCNRQGCHYFEWATTGPYLSGYDLPEKQCPRCSQPLTRDGHEISFETFLGLESENIPDIDLNFSGEFQQEAQQYVVDLFTKEIGEHKIFWTGTVSTVAERSAYGYYKSFVESDRGHCGDENKAIAYCTGVKKTTGQHPGGLMIIPKERDILDYSPYNYPSNNKEAGNLTTHFDYHVLKNQLLKIDILGHDDPTGLKMLYELTQVDPRSIFLGDQKIIKLFNNQQVLGLPEFGTNFVTRLLKEVTVTGFADLIAISGLSHGKNVWESNARDLINEKKHTLSTVISSRDDILFFLIQKGVSRKFAYQIMQKVKKGMLLSNSEEKKLQKHDIPQWYIDSCKKIKYLFPKAHAVAYVIMACRFAWFKIHYPAQFYAVYFSIHASIIFDLKTILGGEAVIKEKLKEIKSFKNRANGGVSTKDKALLPTYEVAKEMWQKDIPMVNLDLKLSQATDFTISTVDGKTVLIPPFSVVDRLGLEFAKSIAQQRDQKMFSSQEDFKERTGVNKVVFDNLIELGLFKDLSKGKQNTFDFSI